MHPRRERHRLNTLALLILAAVAVAISLSALRTVLVPFVMALFLTYLMLPLVNLLQLKCKLPRGLAMTLAVVIVFVGIALLVSFVASSVGRFEERAAVYQDRLVAFGERVTALLDEHDIEFGQEQLVDSLQSLPLKDLAAQAVGGVLNFVANTALTLIFTLYLIAGRDPRHERPGIWGDIDRSAQRYIVTKIHTSFATGLVVGFVCWVFGLEFALLFGILTAMLFFVPTVGSIIASLLPLPIAILQFESLGTVVAMMSLIIVAQQLIGNVIEPKLMGRGLDLHPVTVLLSLALWGLIWGIVGMLLSAPLTAIVKIMLDRYATTRPAAELLAGRIHQAPDEPAPDAEAAVGAADSSPA